MHFKHLTALFSVACRPVRGRRGPVLAFAVWCLTSLPAQAGLQRFGADVTDSHWRVTASALSCQLSHVIPLYGEARFVQRAGGKGVAFSVQVRRPPLHKAEATLTAQPPGWQHTLPPRPLGELAIQPTATPFRLGQVRARRLLAELRAGMFPTLSYTDWADGQDEVQVAISAVNFRPAMKDFQACTRKLLPFSFEDIRRIRVHFATNKSSLSRKARAHLSRLARYLAADKRVLHVDIKGYADAIGTRRYNRALSRRRADAARAFLVDKGVAAARIRIHAFGERKPVSSNATASGRAKNRRVVVLVDN